MSVLTKERWKPIIYKGIDYTGMYEVSNLGRTAIIKNGVKKVGHFKVVGRKSRKSIKLTKGGITISVCVNRLVGEMFKIGRAHV